MALVASQCSIYAKSHQTFRHNGLMAMETLAAVTFRASAPSEDTAIAQHFYALWRDLGIPADDIQPNWLDITLEFMTTARQTLNYQAFVAEVEGIVIGSAGGQRFSGLYPLILSPQHRQYGYIWSVYVEPAYRRQGIATQLTQLVVEHLKAIGCIKALLNAAPQARSIYAPLGFEQSNLMELDLAPNGPDENS
ncbi:MAG: GNAT family N-acetyltransferase [Cyanobacteria bacterium J06638_6]